MKLRKANKASGQEMEVYGLQYTDFIRWLEKDSTGRYSNLKLWLYKNDFFKDVKFTPKKHSAKAPKNKIILDEDINKVA